MEKLPVTDATEEAGVNGLTRRGLLARGAQMGAGVTLAGSMLAACGGSSTSSESGGGSGSTGASNAAPWAWSSGEHGLAELPGGTPVRGGTLKMGTISYGPTETVYPGLLLADGDYARSWNIFEYLFYDGRAVSPVVPGLALSAESNKSATNWIIHLRPGVLWHDGSPFTADDVVWNFKAIWSQPSNLNYGSLFGVDWKAVRKLNNLTVEVPLMFGIADFPTLFTGTNGGLVKNGMTQKEVIANPIGTGPFVLKSFTPGKYSVMTANEHYWEEGKPYVDQFIVDSSFTDQTALTNALLSGNVDLAPGLLYTFAREQLATKQIQVLESSPQSSTQLFNMRLDKGPYADLRVRQAFRLLVDRQAMINAALSGFGGLSYDVIGAGAPYFDTSLVRHQDVEQAKSLFKAAGVLGHTFPITTSTVWPGQIESATVLKEQAAAAGVTVNLIRLPTTDYYTSAGGFLTRPGSQDYSEPNPSLASVWRLTLTSTAPFNETHWGSQPGGAASEKLITAAIAETDHSKAADLWRQNQVDQFNRGGWISWATFPFLDGAGNNVRGLKAGGGFDFNMFRMQDGWLAK